MSLRIGHGYDVHAFTEGEHLMLGGVSIPFSRAFKAHSDGDVLLHAVCDALLGALGLGDIGRHFPDTDSQYADIDSRVLLREVKKKADSLGYALGNLDVTIIAQAPKMAPHLDGMQLNIASDLGAATGQINIKATTTEWLGFTGREEGIEVHAVVLLIREGAHE
ncbi:MAG: 2-C-methyl-D-erythritol 2,4-cyclodiphosphate synthase [bacterium]